MTDRGLSTADGSPACPFVAFEDDRDERADRPDHRHRCFAETVPAPRALAHQEAYCLSSAFPVCPTFQDWARREAAQARPGGLVPAGASRVTDTGAADEDLDESAEGDDAADAGDAAPWSATPDVPIEERPRRNPPRDWAAPPPWAGSAAAAGAAGAGSLRGPGGDADADVPEEGRGLAGSAADRLAQGEDPDHAWLDRSGGLPRPDGTAGTEHDVPDGPSAPADPELAGLVGRSAASRGRGSSRVDQDAVVPPARPVRRPTVSSTRDRSRDRDREREHATPERVQHDGPSWEQSRRYEAYPSIRARMGSPSMPQLPRIGVLFGAVVVAALLLLLLPTLLNIGGRVDTPAGASASASGAAASPSVEPTPIPEPTPQIYTIKAGDALARIARRFGLTLDQLMAANKDIKDANKIKVGDKIVIPTPPPGEVGGESPAAPSPSPS